MPFKVNSLICCKQTILTMKFVTLPRSHIPDTSLHSMSCMTKNCVRGISSFWQPNKK